MFGLRVRPLRTDGVGKGYREVPSSCRRSGADTGEEGESLNVKVVSGGLLQSNQPCSMERGYRVGANTVTVVSVRNAEFILVVLCVNYCIIFRTNSCEPSFGPPCISPSLGCGLSCATLVHGLLPDATQVQTAGIARLLLCRGHGKSFP